MRDPVLSVQRLEVPFGAGPGLRDVTFDVAAGERFVVLGASGAGKTSLLRAIAGLSPIAAGTVAIRGLDVTASAAERRDAVYLHQTPVLFPHLTVYENVAFPLRVRRAADVDHRVRAALAAVHMSGFAPRLPRTLSGGQAHRVALARAVVARPALLLLDEPLASLDPVLREEIRQTIIGLQSEWDGAMIVATHDLDEMSALADRVAIVLDRRIAQIATPAGLLSHPATLGVARFLGHTNEITGHVDDAGVFTCPLGSLSLGAPPGDTIAVFPASAVRPQVAGVRAIVKGIRYRARGSAAIIDFGRGEAEMLVDPLQPPAAGDEIDVALDPRGVVLFQNVETPSVDTSSTRMVSKVKNGSP
jgi:putative spermidine/putrescine transport system ATP-binding protein